MKINILARPTVSMVQMLLLLFTICYGISCYADGNNTSTNTSKFEQGIQLAKGQPYVPPQEKPDCA